MDEFEDHRRVLFGIAYRMLASVSDAEDIVQAPSGRNQVAKAISIEPGYSIVATNPSLGVMRIDASDLANLDAVLGG